MATQYYSLFLKEFAPNKFAYIDTVQMQTGVDSEGNPTYANVPYDDGGTGDGHIWSTEGSIDGYAKINDIDTFIAIDGFALGGADFLAKKDCARVIVESAGGGDADAGLDTVSSADNKRLLASYLIGSVAKRITIFGGDFAALEAATQQYNLLAINCRTHRFNHVVTNGHTYIPQHMATILAEIGQLDRHYTSKGLKGQPYDPSPTYPYGLSNYLNGIAPFDGIEIVPYLGTTCVGLKDKGWYGINGDPTGTPIADIVTAWNAMLFETGV